MWSIKTAFYANADFLSGDLEFFFSMETRNDLTQNLHNSATHDAAIYVSQEH